MNMFNRILMTLILTGMLSSAWAATDDSDTQTGGESGAGENSAAEMMLKKQSPLETLPTKIEYGSIEIKGGGNITELASLATVTVEEAIRRTRLVLQEQITAVELAAVEGYLVWQVLLVRGKDETAILIIDAGTGDYLAIAPLENTRPWWRL